MAGIRTNNFPDTCTRRTEHCKWVYHCCDSPWKWIYNSLLLQLRVLGNIFTIMMFIMKSICCCCARPWLSSVEITCVANTADPLVVEADIVARGLTRNAFAIAKKVTYTYHFTSVFVCSWCCWYDLESELLLFLLSVLRISWCTTKPSLRNK